MPRLVIQLALAALVLSVARPLLASDEPTGPSRSATSAVDAGARRPPPAPPAPVLAPNPARPGVPIVLTLTLPESDWVAFEVFDVNGRRIAARPLERMEAGRITRRWEPGLQRPGLYLVRCWIGSGATAAARLVIVK